MRSVTLKSAITPFFIGLMATMLAGVRPSMSLASLPTATISPLFLLRATMEGSLTTMPRLLAKTSVLAVPRSMARSDEKILKRDRKFIVVWLIKLSPEKSFHINPLRTGDHVAAAVLGHDGDGVDSGLIQRPGE